MPFLSFPKTRPASSTIAGLVLSALFCLIPGARATTQPLDGFNPNANSIVNSVALQPDGKILIAGYFTQLNPNNSAQAASGHIARLNHDGSVDKSFTPSTDDEVSVMVLQPNGQVIVGGRFQNVQPSGAGKAQSRSYAARFNSDGSVDSVFNPNPNGVVYAIAYQPNGQIIIGGSFTTVQPAGASAPIARNHVARFNSDGSLDLGFNPNADKPVLALCVEPNGQILIGGGFSTLQPNGSPTAINRSCAARLNSDGSLDSTFDPEPNGSVVTFQVLANGQIIMGGQFIQVQPNGSLTPTQANFLARLNADGSLDTSFIINPLAGVTATALQSDGKLIIAGNFTSVFPVNSITQTSAPYIARINQDGSIDNTFLPQPNQTVNAVAVQPDGNVVIGGYFSALSPLDSAFAVTRNFIARVGPYGTPDTTLDPDSQGMIFASITLPSGETYIGGTFQTVGGASQSYLAKLTASGSLDTSFTPTVNGPVQSLCLDSSGKLLIGGSFTQVDGFTLNHMARLNPDGTVDGAFNPSPNGSVVCIALQGTQIIISGSFSALQPNGSTVSYGVNYLARLNDDGSLDLNFNPNPNGTVFAIAFQSDGRMVVGGGFTAIGGVNRGHIARLLSTGAIDTAVFDPETNSTVLAIAIQQDGKILIGGGFDQIEPQTNKAGSTATPSTTNTTITQYGNTITVPLAGYSATTPIPVNFMARLLTDGELDTSFFPDPSGEVLSLALQPNGQILVGGVFTSFAPNGNPTGTLRNYIGLVNTDGSIDPNFNPNANELVQGINLLSSGQIVVTGLFTTLQPNGAASPITVNHIAFLNGSGTLVPSFSIGSNSSVTGAVTALSEQPTGQLLVGGSFSPIGGNTNSYMARFNADGTPDAVYTPAPDGPVNAISVLPSGSLTPIPTSAGVWLESTGIVRHTLTDTNNGEIVCVAQQSDGKLIVGGLFYAVSGSTTFQNIMRLNTDGTIDTSFNPVPNGVVNAIVIDPQGRIIIGGAFNGIGGNTTSYLARLNSNGTVDTSFLPQPSAEVLTVQLLPSGQMYVGGDFTYATPTATTLGGENSSGTTVTAKAAYYIARFNTDGTLDTAFNPTLNGPVYTLSVLSSGQIVIAGSFSAMTPNASTGGNTTYAIQELARLNSDGTVDKSFYPDPNGPIETLSVLPSGQYLVGGSFTAFQQNPNVTGITEGSAGYIALGSLVARNYLAIVNTDGSVSTSFNPNPNGSVTYLTVQPNGQFLVGGGFTTLQPTATGTIYYRDAIARLNPAGTIDPTFEPVLNGAVDTIFVLADQSVFIGGYFTTVQVGGAVMIGGNFQNLQGNPAPYLGRLNTDGTTDTTFTTHTDGPVNAVVSVATGKTYVGGAFNNIIHNTVASPQPFLALLDANGLPVSSFNPALNGTVDAIAVQNNGQVLIGGAFTLVSGQPANYMARISPSSGALDASFAANLNGPVYTVAPLPNGQVLVGGNFTSVAGTPVGYLARLNSDGSLDSSFGGTANGPVQSIAAQTDGTLYVAGSFTTVDGQALPYAARLLADGSLDSTFNPSPNAPVSTVLVQDDGKVMLGGSFLTAGGLPRAKFARFSAPSPVTQSFSVTGNQSTVSWTRGGPAPLFSSVKIEESVDGYAWKTVGYASSTDGSDWQLTGIAPSGYSAFLVRASGVVASSQGGSSGLIQYEYFVNTTGLPVIESAAFTSGSTGSPFYFSVIATVSGTTFTASGLPPGLQINPLTGVISGTPTKMGSYNVVITATNSVGSTESTLTIAVGAPSSSTSTFIPASTSEANRLVNLSSRTVLTGVQNLITGFVVTGSAPKPVLIRAVGPGLTPFGLTSVLATPEVDVYSSSGALLSKNQGWNSSLSSTFTQVGAFGLTAGSSDVAFVMNAAPGAYTLHVYDPTGKGGVVLAEVYDASPTLLTDTQKLINVSSRGVVSPGAGTLIGGFVIDGSSTKSVLIRGVGPGLLTFGVTDALPDPVLSVYDASGNLVAQNSDWTNQSVSGPDQPTITPADIVAMDAEAGAFALSAQNPDCAVIANLPPGAYTFQITSASNSTGEVIAEVYELP